MAAAVTEWYRQNARALPWREPGFTPWASLVAEFMLQQTPVSRVLPVLAEWLERWPAPADLAREPAGEAVRAWGRLGYPRRALRLHACAVAISEQHDGKVPDSVEELLRLPGVGDYTARAIAVFAYGRRHPVVDTNIRRVLARAFEGESDAAAPSRADLAAMEAVLPEDRALSVEFNAAVMELGALVCTARSPRCGECPWQESCAWNLAGKPESTRPGRKPQARYEGSDRFVRGLMLAALREAEHPLEPRALDALWSDAAQRQRALAGLLADGLVERHGAGYRLPG